MGYAISAVGQQVAQEHVAPVQAAAPCRLGVFFVESGHKISEGEDLVNFTLRLAGSPLAIGWGVYREPVFPTLDVFCNILRCGFAFEIGVVHTSTAFGAIHRKSEVPSIG